MSGLNRQKSPLSEVDVKLLFYPGIRVYCLPRIKLGGEIIYQCHFNAAASLIAFLNLATFG